MAKTWKKPDTKKKITDPTRLVDPEGNPVNRKTSPEKKETIKAPTDRMRVDTLGAPYKEKTINPPTDSRYPGEGMMQLRGYGEDQGYDIGWNEYQGATANERPIDTSDMTLYDGRYYGTPEQIEQAYEGVPLSARQQYDQWEDPYQEDIQRLLGKMEEDFSFDADEHEGLLNAQEQVRHEMTNAMIARGMGATSYANERMTQAVARLVPIYEKMAYGRYQDEFKRNSDLINLMTGLDDRARDQLFDRVELKRKDEQEEYNRQMDKLEMQRKDVKEAWDRVEELGYVDNKASLVLDVEPGTPSKSAREGAIERIQELEDWEREAEFLEKERNEKHRQALEIAGAKAHFDERLAGQKHTYAMNELDRKAENSLNELAAKTGMEMAMERELRAMDRKEKLEDRAYKEKKEKKKKKEKSKEDKIKERRFGKILQWYYNPENGDIFKYPERALAHANRNAERIIKMTDLDTFNHLLEHLETMVETPEKERLSEKERIWMNHAKVTELFAMIPEDEQLDWLEKTENKAMLIGVMGEEGYENFKDKAEEAIAGGDKNWAKNLWNWSADKLAGITSGIASSASESREEYESTYTPTY